MCPRDSRVKAVFGCLRKMGLRYLRHNGLDRNRGQDLGVTRATKRCYRNRSSIQVCADLSDIQTITVGMQFANTRAFSHRNLVSFPHRECWCWAASLSIGFTNVVISDIQTTGGILCTTQIADRQKRKKRKTLQGFSHGKFVILFFSSSQILLVPA